MHRHSQIMRITTLLIVLASCTVTRADLLITPGPPGASYSDYGTLKILTYNAFQRVFPAAQHDDECRARELGKILRNSDYDVVVLQETFDAAALEALSAELDVGPNTLPFRNIRHRPDEGDLEGDGGLSVFSRLALHAPINYTTGEPASGLFSRPTGERYTAPWAELIFQDCNGTTGAGSDCLANKGAIWFQVTVGEVGRVNFMAMHTDALLDLDDIQARQAQFHAIAEWIETYKVPGQPFFLLGDLNVDDTYTGAASLFDSETGCDGCNPDRPAGQRGQRGSMLNILKGTNSAQPISVYQRYVNNQGLTYDHASNHFAIAPAPFRDWDDADYRARFDHLLYYPNSENGLLIGPDVASDIAIVPFANSACTDTEVDFSFLPPRVTSTRTIHHLSDHYGIAARLRFWKYQAPPQASMPPAMPSVPEPNVYTYGPPHYATQDGVTQDGANYTGKYRMFSTLSSDRISGGFPWEIRIEEEQQQGSAWVFTKRWRHAASNYGATIGTPAPPDPDAIVKPMAPGHRYFRYRAQACNPNGCSAWSVYSDPVRVWYPHAPYTGPYVGLAEELLACGNNVLLSWPPVYGATTYVVYASQSYDPSGAKALVYQGPAPTYTDANLQQGLYQYFVHACDDTQGNGIGSPINCGHVTQLDPYPVTTTDAPGAPKQRIPHLRVEHSAMDAHGYVNLTWARVADADAYLLQEATAPTFTEGLTTYTVQQPASGDLVDYSVQKTAKTGDYFYRLTACFQGRCQCGYVRNNTPINTGP